MLAFADIDFRNTLHNINSIPICPTFMSVIKHKPAHKLNYHNRELSFSGDSVVCLENLILNQGHTKNYDARVHTSTYTHFYRHPGNTCVKVIDLIIFRLTHMLLHRLSTCLALLALAGKNPREYSTTLAPLHMHVLSGCGQRASVCCFSVGGDTLHLYEETALDGGWTVYPISSAIVENTTIALRCERNDVFVPT